MYGVFAKLLQQKGIRATDVAKATGIRNSTLTDWKMGRTNPKIDKLQKLADFFDVPVECFLTGEVKTGKRIPVLGRVAAGIPIEAIEEVIDWEEITDEMSKTGEYFGLRIKGQSMEPKIADGSTVIVRRSDSASDGDIVVALVNGSDALCKRLKTYASGIALLSNNPAYEPLYFSDADIETMPVRIIGKAVEVRCKL